VFEIGTSLREARIRRGIDFAQAESATKIRGKYLRALEEEQFELLPAETYVKGFLRTYAEYLGLDGQLYVDEYNSRFTAGEERELRPRRTRTRPKRSRRFETNVVLVALAVIAVLTVVVISAWKSSGGSPKTRTPPAATTRSHTSIPLLTVIAIRGATHVTARRGGASGDVAFDGTVQKSDGPVAIRGTRLWVQVDTPENLRFIVKGHTRVVPGHKPRVIVVTAKGWQPA
jgi:cytoskeletal protein RodZ